MTGERSVINNFDCGIIYIALSVHGRPFIAQIATHRWLLFMAASIDRI